MGFSCGIVGLPNVGKSTLFNSLSSAKAEAANFPFCTVEPNVGVVNATHVDSVVELPPGAQVLGSTQLEPNAAVRFAPSAWGVQFHPELDAEVMRHYFAARREVLLAEGFDIAAGERALRDAPEGALVIDRFLRLALARQSSAA